MNQITQRCRCGNDFTPRTKWQRFCSSKCRRAAFEAGHAEVASVRQTKRGWSVTLHINHRPSLNVGEFASIMRSERLSWGSP